MTSSKGLTYHNFQTIFFDDIEVSGEEIPEVLDAEGRKTIMDVRIYPNPISTESKIEFLLHKPEITDVAIYNSQGQHVKTLLNERASAGINTIYWNGKDDSGKAAVAGLYFVRICSETMTNSTKIIVLE